MLLAYATADVAQRRSKHESKSLRADGSGRPKSNSDENHQTNPNDRPVVIAEMATPEERKQAQDAAGATQKTYARIFNKA
jgi:hypothetical protein